MRIFSCPHCGHTERARALQMWHPCPARPTKTGKPQYVEMTPETTEATP